MSKIEEFKGYVDLYSADLSLWPTEKIKPALSFMEEDAGAKAYFDDMARTEALLRAYADDVVPSAGLEDRILHEATQSPVSLVQSPGKKLINWRPQHFLAPGGGILAVLILGVFIGFGPQDIDYVRHAPNAASSQAESDYLPFIWEDVE